MLVQARYEYYPATTVLNHPAMTMHSTMNMHSAVTTLSIVQQRLCYQLSNSDFIVNHPAAGIAKIFMKLLRMGRALTVEVIYLKN